MLGFEGNDFFLEGLASALGVSQVRTGADGRGGEGRRREGWKEREREIQEAIATHFLDLG